MLRIALVLFCVFACVKCVTITTCGAYPYPITVLTSGTCSDNYFGFGPTTVGVVSEADSTITSFWSSITNSALTSYLTEVLVLRVFEGAHYVLSGDCSFNAPAWCMGDASYTLTSTYVTTFLPSPSGTLVTTTVTEVSHGTDTTISVCQGPDGIITHYTSGPVAGTSTITSCTSL